MNLVAAPLQRGAHRSSSESRDDPRNHCETGARIWNLAALHFPGAILIVDLYHARQHLWEVVRRLYPMTKGSGKAG